MEDIRLRRYCDEGVCKAMHFQRELEQQDAVIAELVEMIKRGINENTSHYSSTWKHDAQELINKVK